MTDSLIGAGQTYTTLQSWEDDCPSNITAAGTDEIWRGKINASTDGFTGTSTVLTISGTTVDPTHYVELTTNTGASFRDNANAQTNALRYNSSNGCYISMTGNWTTGISNSQNYTRISNIQVRTTSTKSNPITSNQTGVIIDNVIFEGKGTAGLKESCYLGGSGSKVRNSLIIQRSSSAAGIARVVAGASLYNCTLVCPSDLTGPSNAIASPWSTYTVKNCAIFGADNVYTGGTPTFTTCLTDDATPPTGCTTATYDTDLFTNVSDGTHDFRITDADSDLYDAGTTDSTEAQYDIVGTERPDGSAYDVGCWELVVASGSSPLLPNKCNILNNEIILGDYL